MWSMSYRLKVVTVCLVLMSMTLIGACFVFWGAGELYYHLERSRLAHKVLEGQLELKAQTYKLFKQRMDALLTETPDNRFDEPQALETLVENLKKLRNLIAAEVAVVKSDREREDEAEELQTLAAVERQIYSIIGEFDEMRRLAEQDRHEEAGRLLDLTLEQTIDENFSRLIRQMIKDEAAEVDAVDVAAARTISTVRWLALALVLVTIAITAGALFTLLSRLQRPSRALVTGTGRLAAGDLSHRVHVDGHDEFADIAANINAMADQLQRHRDTLQAGNESLEQLVAERTTALQKANTALQASDQTRRRLFADISHELRTPLTVIKGEAEIAMRGQPKLPEDYQAALMRIIEQANHTAAMVDDLLFIARSDAGETRIKMQAVALVELVERVCGDAEALASEKDLTIRLQSTVEDAVVTGDPMRLRQAIMILIDNAVRYSPKHSPVEVTVSPATGGVQVQVSDNGIGISADEVDRVFDRFYRGGGADRYHGGGTGLGLPIARAIIEAHGGTITLASRPGEGTEVSIVLPVSRRLRIVA
jgi:two-component system, OmpR family, sensor kinase